MMKRDGLKVSSQTLWEQIEALARFLEPLPKHIQEHILSKSFIGADVEPQIHLASAAMTKSC